LDAWNVKKAPNGLLYVSDYTAFTTSIALTQVRLEVGVSLRLSADVPILPVFHA
jgi:hypothetical protein